MKECYEKAIREELRVAKALLIAEEKRSRRMNIYFCLDSTLSAISLVARYDDDASLHDWKVIRRLAGMALRKGIYA